MPTYKYVAKTADGKTVDGVLAAESSGDAVGELRRKNLTILDVKEIALDQQEISVIADLMPTLNNAVHAQDLDARSYKWAIEVGPQLLAGLDAKIQNINESIT